VAALIRSKHSWLLAALLLVSCQSTEYRSILGRDIRLAPEGVTVQGLVPVNATLESLLRQQDVPATLSGAVVNAIRGVFDPRNLRADQAFWVTRTVDGLFREFRYQIDTDNLLRVVFTNDPGLTAASFDVAVVTLPKDYELTAVSAAITPHQTSLIGAFDVQGETIHLPLRVAEVFAGELDFNSDLQQGDRIDVLFDRATRHGEFVGYGDVQAAVVYADGRRLEAFRFVGADGKASFFDEKGQSLNRQFLRTPLPFDPRVTSGFSNNRFHPVLGVRRPHLGVDFGAPSGTRVMAVSSGVVVTAGWSGDAGRLVRVRHAGGYETMYLHLSAFGPGIHAGARVNQKDVIGYVGSTGTATGPHLDFRVLKDGTYLNPLKAFARMPAGEPVPAHLMPEFAKVRDESMRQLTSRVGDPLSTD
jgi:murein DD-endopeptidase MepM/ murein hydrolase activator NlpD